MKRAFVTGASGFIGAVLVKQLLSRGVSVAVLRRNGSQQKRLLELQNRLHIVECQDGRVKSLVADFNSFAPDTVFHLGWAGVGNAFRNETHQQFENVEFAVELAELSVIAGVEHWIGAGSQAEYGPKNQQIRESDLPQPTTLYGAAKLSAGIMTERIATLGGIRHSWLRIFSTYGPDDNPDWMLPMLIRSLLDGNRPSLTEGQQVWDYLHVEDAASAFIAVANASVTGLYNLGSGEAVPLRTVVETVRDLIDPSLPLGFGEIPYRTDQVMCLHADVSRLTAATGWRRNIILEQGVRAIVEFERSRTATNA